MTQLEDSEQRLSGILDLFNGITVDVKKNKNSENFAEKLKASMEYWRANHVRGVSLRIPIEHSELIPFCVQNGLVFHHAQPDYVMMNTWLPEGEECLIPSYAHTFVGVGGFVVNDKNEVLVVQECCTSPPMWKLPGGAAELGEIPEVTACREVEEETGIVTEFDYVLCFRHMPEFRHRCDDIYIVCVLRPLTTEIRHDPREIADCRWMPIDEYVSHPNATATNRFIGDCYLKSKATGSRMSVTHIMGHNSRHRHAVYHLDATEKPV